MQLATKATLLAAIAISASMLMDTAAAVEVTDTVTPRLPTPESAQVGVDERQLGESPPSPDCFILGTRSFSIPFTVDAAGTQPVEVHLFVSRGADDQWKLLDRRRPDVAVKQFQFTAENDGEYWFATRTIDAQGLPHPTGVIESQLKVYVDTTKPNVKLEVDADATGRVDAVLAINDATPVKTMQLRYVTDNVSQWQNVDIPQLPPNGKLQFTPADAWKQLSIQFVATDTPGNQSVVTQLLRRPRLAESLGSRYAAATDNSIEARSTPYRISVSESLNAQTASGPVIKLDRNKPKPPSNLMTAHGYAPTRATESALHGFRGAAFPSQQPAPAATAPQTSPGFPRLFPSPQSTTAGAPHVPFAPPSVQGATIPSNMTSIQNQFPQPMTSGEVGNGFGLNSPQQSAPESAPVPNSPVPQSLARQSLAPQSPAPKPRRARTPAQAMRPLSEASAVPNANVPNSSLPDFSALGGKPEEIPAPTPELDPAADRYKSMRPFDSAIAMGRVPIRYSDSVRFSLEYELEAVGSQGVDAIELYGSLDGQRWALWGQDPDRISPFDIETKEQGVFGFRIVVVGQNGLASPRPLAGETPDIVVVVDAEKPTVRITGAQYGEGDRVGALVIRYECEDTNLMKRPIALSFSDNLQGPWTTIAAGLRNDGDYIWPADPQLPRQLFLRIDATDQAGNVGTYILDQPIDSQGLAPRARIRGFQSLSGGELPATGEQTAQRPAAAFK